MKSILIAEYSKKRTRSTSWNVHISWICHFSYFTSSLLLFMVAGLVTLGKPLCNFFVFVQKIDGTVNNMCGCPEQSSELNCISMWRTCFFFDFFFFYWSSSNLNRCEAFSTYPRTYDLLHAWTVFSDIEKKGCSAEDLLIEMDRILRPNGFVIVRDRRPVAEFIKKYLTALHWESVAVVDAESSSDLEDREVILLIQKKMWLIDGSSKKSA